MDEFKIGDQVEIVLEDGATTLRVPATSFMRPSIGKQGVVMRYANGFVDVRFYNWNKGSQYVYNSKNVRLI